MICYGIMETIINDAPLFSGLIPVFDSVHVVRVPITVQSNVFFQHIGEDYFVFLKNGKTAFSYSENFEKFVCEDIRRVEQSDRRWSHVRITLRNGGLSEIKFYVGKTDDELIHLGKTRVDACGYQMRWNSRVLIDKDVKKIEQDARFIADVKN